MMYKQTMWYEIYSGRKINWDSFGKYFDKNGDDESWYIYYVEEDNEPTFELHAHIDGDTVISVEPFKADVYGGHGRPIIDEKNLNSSEKKYAVSIFEECFPDRVGDTLDSIIGNAISAQVQFGGYSIFKPGLDFVTFISPEGKKVKLSNKILVKAIDYSYIDLAILRDVEVVCEFAHCFGIKNYEPLVAILFTIDPTGYSAYGDLERKYRFSKMEAAVALGNIEKCAEYIDVLHDPQNNVLPFCTSAVSQDNKVLLMWLIDNISGAKCNLESVLGTAIKKDNEELFYYLLDSGMVDASTSDSTQGYAPMYVAAYYKEHNKYVLPLLQRGFSLAAKTAYGFYRACTLDEIAMLLPYKVEFDQNTINRIYSEGRQNIISELEEKPLRFCTTDALFAAYIHCGDFEKFAALLRKGHKNNSHELFAMAYKNSYAWTDLWLEHGFDINCNSSRLLHKACENIETDWAIYLLTNGANPHLKEQYSQTIFEKAGGYHGYLSDEQQKEKERLCKYLLDIGLDPIMESRRAPSILTYLFGGTEDFKLVLTDWLAKQGKLNSPDLPDECADTKHLPIANILDEFSRKYNPKVLHRFIEKGAITNAEGLTDDKLFLSACKLCDVEELQMVVSAGANISETNKYYGTNGLYAAVESGRPYEVIKYLVELGVDINNVHNAYHNAHGYTRTVQATSILDVAEKKGDAKIIEYLKSQGALHASEIM